VLEALREVANASIARQKNQLARDEQARAVQAYQAAVQAAAQRYVAGQAGYYELLQQQQQLFPAENILVQIELNEAVSLVDVYRALGRGW
jgi:multidrug efflux system outer membrane protein